MSYNVNMCRFYCVQGLSCLMFVMSVSRVCYVQGLLYLWFLVSRVCYVQGLLYLGSVMSSVCVVQGLLCLGFVMAPKKLIQIVIFGRCHNLTNPMQRNTRHDKPQTNKPQTQQTLDITNPRHNKHQTRQTLDITNPRHNRPQT